MIFKDFHIESQISHDYYRRSITTRRGNEYLNSIHGKGILSYNILINIGNINEFRFTDEHATPSCGVAAYKTLLFEIQRCIRK